MKIVLLAQCITEDCLRRRRSQTYLSAAGRKKTLNLCAYLAALGHEVSVLSNSYAKSNDTAYTERISHGISVRHAPTLSIFRRHSIFKRTISSIFTLLELFAKRKETDLVIIYNYHAEYSIPALIIERFFGTPLVLDYEDGLFLDRRYQTAAYGVIERSVYQRCRAFILVNAALKDRIERVSARSASKPMAVVHSLFNNALVEAPREKKTSDKQLLFSGNFSRGFGFDELKSYIEHLPEHYTLTICGKANSGETEEIKSLCDRHPRVQFLGFVPDAALQDVLNSCEAVILLSDRSSPYSSTNFPSKLYDYLSNGKTVISTRSANLQSYETLHSIVFLDSIEADMPKLSKLLAGRRFDAEEVMQLHERILGTLNQLLLSTTLPNRPPDQIASSP